MKVLRAELKVIEKGRRKKVQTIHYSVLERINYSLRETNNDLKRIQTKNNRDIVANNCNMGEKTKYFQSP